MKHTKSILMAAVAALSIASASAEVIYITGATAFRSAANNTLYSLYGTNLFVTAGSSATDEKATALYFTNCLLTNGTRHDLAVTWCGSEGGMQSVASGTNNKRIPFYDLAVLTAGGITNRTTGVMAPDTTNMLATAGAYTSLQKGIIGCADSFQASSRFQANKKAKDGASYRTLILQKVGVVPYSPIASKGFATAFPDRNITLNNFWNIVTSVNPLTGEKISGKEADKNIQLYGMGRNVDSGTRVIMIAANKGGVADKLVQYKVTASAGTATKLELHPATTINGIGTSDGEGGETSGGTVAAGMTNVISPSATVPVGVTLGSSNNFLIGYASVADVTVQHRTNGLVPLKFNGIEGRCYNTNSSDTFTKLDAGYTNIINGSYPWWGYEFVSYDNLVASTNAKAFANNFVKVIKEFPSTNSVIAPNIQLSDMKVSRTIDGGNQN